MKHLLDIKYFLTEALTPYYKRKYKYFFKERPKVVVEDLNKLLDNKERVYIPYESDTISETQLKVKSYLEDQGYKIMDYKLNSAVQIENSKRQLRISKLLVKNPELLKEFTLDDTRANTRVGSDFSIVLTSNYEDVAGMSFERCWTNSCLNIQSGVNKRYVADEVQQGTVVAYLINGNDLEIEEPLGRVNIKPFYSLRDENEVLYVVDRRVYGNVPDEKLFKEIINQYLKEKQEVKLVGFYNKMDGLYSDQGSPHWVLIEKDYKVCYDCKYDEDGFDRQGYNRQGYDEDGFNRQGYDKEGFNKKGFNREGFDKEGYNKEGYNKYGFTKNGDQPYPYQEHLTRDQYIWLKDNIKSKYNRGFHVDDDGLVNVDETLYISAQNLTKLPVKFGVVKGNFGCSNNNLTSLEGAPIVVRGFFDCSNNNLTSLEGSPKEVEGFYCHHNNLISLEGVTSVVRGNFDCSYNPNLTNLVGSPSWIRFIFNCSNNPNLISLEGVPREVGGFNCSNNPNLISLDGGPSKVREDFNCSENNLTSLVGAPKEVGRWFNCTQQRNGHQFTKEDVIKVSQVGGFSLI